MKNRKCVFVSIIAGMISCSYCMTASADSYVNGGMLKNGLLAVSKVNLSEYNTNDDSTVNVIDLVRVKNRILKSSAEEKQFVSLECEGPWVSADKSKLTVPVSIKGNKSGVSAVSFKVEYDNWNFELRDVYPSSDGQAVFSKKNDVIQYTTPDGENMRSEGYLLYLEFAASPKVNADRYDIEISEVQFAKKGADGKETALKSDEYKNGAVLSFDFFREKVTEPPVITTVPETTTAVTTTTAATTTTVPVTTKVTVTETKSEPPKTDKLNFSLDKAELSSDGKQLRIPVYMDVNERGLNSLSMNVKYDQKKFFLSGAEFAGFDGYGYIAGNKDNAVLTMNNGQNLSQRSGVIAYLKFDVNGGADSKTYDFELSDIRAYYSENWNQKPVDKLENKSKVYKYTLGSVNTVTEPPVQTSPPPATTTTVTSKVQEPLTTTTVSVTVPVTTTTVNAPPSVEPAVNLESVEKEIVEMINKDRKSKSMEILSVSSGLCSAADARAKELSVKYSTERPNGETLSSLFAEHGVFLSSYSSVCVATGSTADVVYSKIMSGKDSKFDTKTFNKIGIGHYYSSNSSYGDYWVVFVGR